MHTYKKVSRSYNGHGNGHEPFGHVGICLRVSDATTVREAARIRGVSISSLVRDLILADCEKIVADAEGLE